MWVLSATISPRRDGFAAMEIESLSQSFKLPLSATPSALEPAAGDG